MTNLQKIEKFINENPSNSKVKSLVALLNKPISLSGSLGKRYAEVSNMAEQAYS